MNTDNFESNEKGTIYLDIDGVIIPYYDERDFTQTDQGLEKKWISRYEFYYPEVVAALGGVAAKVISSSSRGVSFLFDNSYEQLRKDLGLRSTLVTDPFRPVFIPNKFSSVRHHWVNKDPAFWPLNDDDTRAVGSKAVWIDDHAAIEDYHELHKDPLISDPNFLVIRPLGKMGLTLDHVKQIKDFLN